MPVNPRDAESDDRNPWDRRPRERDAPWAAFLAYRDLGPDRTLSGAMASLHPGADHRKNWRAWRRDYDWDARAEAYDRHLELVRARAVELAVQQDGVKWARRGEELREELWAAAAKMMRHVDYVLLMPPVEQTSKNTDTGVTQVIKALPLKEVVAASVILRNIREIAAGSVDDGLRKAQEAKDTPDDPSVVDRCLSEAERKIAEFERRMLSNPPAPPLALDGPAADVTSG